MKTCKTCKIQKPYTEFHKHKLAADKHKASCKDCRKIEKKEYRIKNIEKISRVSKIYTYKNRDKIKAYRESIPEKMYIYKVNFNSNKKGSKGKLPLNAADYLQNYCLRCGTEENLSIDHIVPISKGGNNTLENIQSLCRSCNSIKHGRVYDYRDLRFRYFNKDSTKEIKL